MSWIIDEEKARTQSNIVSNIAISISNVSTRSDEINDSMVHIQQLLGDVPSGSDARFISAYRRALSHLSQASVHLRKAIVRANALDTVRWIDDEN